jgi:hypothetical protein
MTTNEQISALAAHGGAHLQLVYLANFHNGSYDPSVDKLQLGALQRGEAGVLGSNPTWTPQDGAIELKVTKPDAASDLVSAGLFATGQNVHFGPGSVLDIKATFIRPAGPLEEGVLWAAAIQARTGGTADLGTEKRAAVTFQVRGPTARMNVRGIVGKAQEEIPQSTYDAIFSAIDPQPFTLELIIDRTTGDGAATFRAGDVVRSRNVTFADFKRDSGPVITAIGSALAIDTADNETASVQVREFRISTSSPQH